MATSKTANQYILYDQEKEVGRFTAAELAKKLGCNIGVIRLYASSDFVYRGRYRFAKTDEKELDTNAYAKPNQYGKTWVDEYGDAWNAARKQVLKGLGKEIRT